MKRYLRMASLLAFAALVTLTISACVAHCSPVTTAQPSHDCCHLPDATSHTADCTFCSITTASQPETNPSAYLSSAANVDAFKLLSRTWGTSHLTGFTLAEASGFSPQQKELVQRLNNDGIILKQYQQLISHIYFELT